MKFILLNLVIYTLIILGGIIFMWLLVSLNIFLKIAGLFLYIIIGYYILDKIFNHLYKNDDEI